MKRTRLRSVSKSRAAENRRRAVVTAELRAGQPWCSRCGVATFELDVHEVTRRSQYRAGVTDTAVQVLLCRDCHRFVTENPQAGHDEGWVRWSWEPRGKPA